MDVFVLVLLQILGKSTSLIMSKLTMVIYSQTILLWAIKIKSSLWILLIVINKSCIIVISAFDKILEFCMIYGKNILMLKFVDVSFKSFKQITVYPSVVVFLFFFLYVLNWGNIFHHYYYIMSFSYQKYISFFRSFYSTLTNKSIYSYRGLLEKTKITYWSNSISLIFHQKIKNYIRWYMMF